MISLCFLEGFVTIDRWMHFLKQKHAQMGKKKIEKGDRWLKSFLFTLRLGCGDASAQEDLQEQTEVRGSSGPTPHCDTL